MTLYRLMDGASGRPGVGSSGTQPPTSPSAYSGNFIAGTEFYVTGQMVWLQGFYWWVPAGGDTGAQKFCLWIRNSNSVNSLVSGTTVTSGTLTASQWNYVPLTIPVQLAPGENYIAATGWTSVNGFPSTNNQFGSAQPYSAGITNGPITAGGDSSSGGTNTYPANAGPQGCFSVAANDPTAHMPDAGSNSANFWVDIEVSDTAPANYSGSYRFWPGMTDATGYTNDTANNFTLGMEFSVTKACDVNNVWFYSPSGVTQLPTSIGIFEVSGQALVASNSSPSWSGAAGSGWVSAALSGSLDASTNYKVAVCNGAGTPAVWNATTALYWSTGFGGNDLTAGPLYAPNNATADSPGQSSYHSGAALSYPDTNVGPWNYWVDIELTPQAPAPGPATVLYSMRMMP